MAAGERTFVERAPRYPFHFPLRYLKSGVSGWRKGETVNISHTGILFSAGEAIAVDSELEIRVQFPNDALLSCSGSVVRSHKWNTAVSIDRSSYSRPSSG
jgi:hypothetical protein